jgi:hypothetical protein
MAPAAASEVAGCGRGQPATRGRGNGRGHGPGAAGKGSGLDGRGTGAAGRGAGQEGLADVHGVTIADENYVQAKKHATGKKESKRLGTCENFLYHIFNVLQIEHAGNFITIVSVIQNLKVVVQMLEMSFVISWSG